MSNDPASDDKPRLIVVIPVILVCLGAIYLLLNSRKPSRGSVDSFAGSNGPAASGADAAASNRFVSRSASYRLGLPLRSATPDTQLVEQPARDGAELATRPPVTSSESGSVDATAVGGAVLLDPGIEITGKVILAGTPPAEVLVDMSSDPVCAGAQKSPPMTRHYVLNKSGGLANVFVHIKTGLDGKRFPISTNVPVIGPSNCFFEPYLFGLQANQKVQFFNADKVVHDAHISPQPGSGNKERNIGLLHRGAPVEISFPQPEVFLRIKCDVHPWEFGYVGVVAHPFFAVTDTNGLFKLPPTLPPGRYTLEAVHLKAGAVSKEIEVQRGEKKTVNFTLQVSTPP